METLIALLSFNPLPFFASDWHLMVDMVQFVLGFFGIFGLGILAALWLLESFGIDD